MEINYYRHVNVQGYDESWQACQFNGDTDLTPLRSNNLVSINGLPYLRQHHVTFLTGRETCRAHHFAKHLAIQVLSADQSSTASSKVLWIDTLNGPHVGAAIFSELSQHVQDKHDLHYLCLDVLGGLRDDHWWIMRNIEQLISQLKPQLVVIDDIDHFFPLCGIRLATEFDRVVRDSLNHSDTAFLFIGYNLTGKKACTAGLLGKMLFTSANDIFSLSTVRDVTSVRHLNGYDMHVNPDDAQFHFSIGPDNLPLETRLPRKAPATGIDDDTLTGIVGDIIHNGHDITPRDLLAQVKARHNQLKRDCRDAALLDQINRLNLLDHTSGDTTINSSPSSLDISKLAHGVNNSLTLPPHPHPVPSSSPSAATQPDSLCRDSVAVEESPSIVSH